MKKSTKESTVALLKRYVWLADLIRKSKRISLSAINEKWCASTLNDSGEAMPRKTFDNHLRAIEDLFEINIECDKTDGYVYYIENAESVAENGMQRWLLDSIAVNNLINESQQLKLRILFEHIPSGQQFLTSIIEAMRDGVELTLTYQNYWRPEARTFNVAPYCVKVFKQRWYLLAHNNEYDQIRIYSLDRIHALQASDQQFALPPKFDGEAYFADCFGIINDDTTPQRITIKVCNERNKDRYFKSLPLHRSQEMVEESETHTTFSYYLQLTFDFQQELLSHGPDIEVLSPKSFRNKIAHLVNETISNYEL